MHRRTVLTAVLGTSIAAFIGVISACAEAPPPEELIAVQEPTEPEAGAEEAPKPLPPSNPPPAPVDAGTADSGKKAPPPPPPPPPEDEKCDPDDMMYQVQAMARVAAGDQGDDCPCGSGMCCYEMELIAGFKKEFCFDKP